MQNADTALMDPRNAEVGMQNADTGHIEALE